MHEDNIWNAWRNVLRLSIFSVALSSSSALADQELRQGDTVNVKVRSTAVRSEAKAWASPVSLASYGDALTVVTLGGGWVKVKTAGGKQGYVHASSVTPRKVVLSSKGVSDYQADSSEIVMAGKGFNKKIEERFAAGNANVNLKDVDAMERLKVKPAEVAAFVRDGKLGGNGGGA